MTKPNWKQATLLIMIVVVAGTLWACGRQSTSTSTSNQSTVETSIQVTNTTQAESPILVATAVAASPTVEESASAEEVTTTTGEESSAQTFTIDQSQSVASFTLDEELLGVPTTVVGTTSLVNGEIQINPANPSATNIGTIQIDASALTTDSDRRNGAIRRFILQTNDAANQYITFTPTTIDGLPASVAVGDSFTVQITGDLTISGVTNPVTFATVINVLADNQISGTATAEVLRSDFELTIPSVPSVANVTDAVQLQLDFVASA